MERIWINWQDALYPCDTSAGMYEMGEAFSLGLDFVRFLGITLFLYLLPGWALLRWVWRKPDLSWGEQVGLAASLSLAIYPIVMLWSYQLGLRPGSLTPWIIGGAGLVFWLWSWLPQLRSWPSRRRWLSWQSAPDYCYIVLIGLLVVTRLLPIRTMSAPAWGDSVHHTLIVQLMLDHGGLFQSWEPYAPLVSFSYHFGFHSAIANWAWLSGMEAADAVLIGAQMINVLAVLALYPMAVRLAGGNRWAGVVAVLLAGLWSQMPAYYVNWGRYTQLAGQTILPGLVWAFDMWWTEKARPTPRLVGLMVVLGTGLALTHYRIVIVAAAAGLAWALWSLWQHRYQRREWLARTVWVGGAALLIGLLILPWLWNVRSTRLPYVAGYMAQRGLDPAVAGGDLVAWGVADLYYTRLGWVSALVALLFALLRKPKVAVVILLWSFLTFMLTNPYLLGLPGSGLVNNFTLAIGAYLVLALALGWAAAEIGRLLPPSLAGRFVVIVLLGVLAVFGVRRQLPIVDPTFQMVTPADEAALAWIDQHVAADARFLVNGFLAYTDTVVVGSDAGWWLPYYTRRANNVPPITYTTELLASEIERPQIRQFIIDLRASNGGGEELPRLLCHADITHVYLGDRQGEVGAGVTALIPAAWLTRDDHFQLLHQAGQAQVWAFASEDCPALAQRGTGQRQWGGCQIDAGCNCVDATPALVNDDADGAERRQASPSPR